MGLLLQLTRLIILFGIISLASSCALATSKISALLRERYWLILVKCISGYASHGVAFVGTQEFICKSFAILCHKINARFE